MTNEERLIGNNTGSTPISTIKDRIKSVSLIFACGTALFSDGYANGVIGSVNVVLTLIYGSDILARHNYSTTFSSLAFVGTIVGMVFFGYLSDKIGRKFGMMSAAIIVMLFSGLSAASSGAHGSAEGTLKMLSGTRFLLGIGVGAEYPCGSVAASEQSEEPGINKNAQHRWIGLATNTMIDFGVVVGSFVPLLLFWIFGNHHLRAVWRLSLGMGALPAILVLVWRLNMEESPRYKKDSMKSARIPYRLVIKRYWKSLAAISAIWFLYDFIAYPFGLFSSIILNNVIGGSDNLTIVLGWNVIISLFNMPGTIGGSFIVDYLGPKNTLIVGLTMQATIGFVMSGLYARLTRHIAIFAVVYGIFLSFGELGPGICTFLLAGKTSSTAVRGQFFGIAAATGKVGAIIGIWVFPRIVDAFGGVESARGITGPFWVGSGIALLSALITLLFVKPLSHDGMIEEDRSFREYLELHGYDTSSMGVHLSDIPSSEEASVEKDPGESIAK